MDRRGLLDSYMFIAPRARTGVRALICAGLAAVWAAAPAAAPGQERSVAGGPLAPSSFAEENLSPEYRVAPGDVLLVFVWREAELTGEVRVRTDGHLTVPLLGDVLAVGKTPRELGAELAEELGRFINAPTVTVTVVSSSSQRFFVVGEVTRPGEYPLTSRTTVLQALALAGGFQEYAKTDEIKIVRQEVLRGRDGRPYTREQVLSVDYGALARGHELEQNFVLKPSDVIVVP